MTQPIIHDEQPDRREVFAAINAGIDAGLPFPSCVSIGDAIATPISSVYITLDSLSDLCAWRDFFGMQKRSVSSQPYPSLTDPAVMRIWVSGVWMDWRGWHLSLQAQDPITNEQRDEWMASGAADRHAAYLAAQASA